VNTVPRVGFHVAYVNLTDNNTRSPRDGRANDNRRIDVDDRDIERVACRVTHVQ